MPKKVLPTQAAFAEFDREMQARNFQILSPREFRQDRQRLDLVPPFPRKGRELGYIYQRKGYDVIVWTTWLPLDNKFRDQDAGRVLIRDGDKVLYHATPTHRTKNFLDNLLEKAKLARAHVKYRPLCWKCFALMYIDNGKFIKQRRWRCTRTEDHDTKRFVFSPWDEGLPLEALKALKPRRKRRAKYIAKLKKEGKKPGAVLRVHKGWTARRPQNLVPARR